MSNEPKRNVASFEDGAATPAAASDAVPDVVSSDVAPSDRMPMDLTADAEIALAAVRRIESALRARYAEPPLVALRRQIDSAAADVAEARLALALDQEYGARTVDPEALLQRLAQRLDAMALTAGAGCVLDEDAAEAETATRPEPKRASRPAPSAIKPTEAERIEPQLADLVAEQVPTVQRVVSRLGWIEETGTTTVDVSVAAFARAPSVAMLEAMVEALTAMPSQPAPREEAADEPAADARPTESDEPSQTVALSAADDIAIPTPGDTPAQAFVEPAAETVTVAAPAADAHEPPADVTTNVDETAELAATATIADAAISPSGTTDDVAAHDAAADNVAAPEIAADDVAADDAESAPLLPDRELIESFAQMAAMPYLPPEVGTAVIFAPRPETDAPAAMHSDAAEESVTTQAVDRSRYPVNAPAGNTAAGFATTAPGLAMPSPAAADATPRTEDGVDTAKPVRTGVIADRINDGADDSDPAGFLLGPATPAPRALSRPDPLAPLRARSAAETIALFS